MDRLAAFPARTVDIDGCTYREGLNAVRISGGVANNVIPDACVVTVNFVSHLTGTPMPPSRCSREVRPGLRPGDCRCRGRSAPRVVGPCGGRVRGGGGGVAVAKFGWTDVARFSALGILR